ncbi:hypothetical protein [Streptomyces tubercidicus]
MAQDRFVNPYTFVQVPRDEPDGWRQAPFGHGRLGADRFSGVICVELTARSPLLLRNVYDGEPGFPRRRLPGFEEPVPFLPGSSLAGTVRAVHETLAGGCLRVFDADFRPGYRDSVQAGQKQRWMLALVEAVDADGKPVRMRRCPQEPVWVESQALQAALGGEAGAVRTGARVTVLDRGERTLDRWQQSDADRVRAGGDWVVHPTDARTRKGVRRGPDGRRDLPGRYFCATGQLEETVRKLEFGGGVWEAFLDAVDGTRDMQVFRQRPGRERDDSAPEWVEVRHPGSDALLAHRMAGRRRLYPGQTVWVRCELSDPGRPSATLPASQSSALGADGAGHVAVQRIVIHELALAVVWRHAGGDTTAGERVPPHARPCTDPAALCPSCRVFGSADTDGGGRRGRADQRGYRGHVRFGDGVPQAAYPTRTEYLPPLSAPRPGAGQTYLVRSGSREGTTATAASEPPLREWGSQADPAGAPRLLRGRKHYWLTRRPAHRPYFRARALDSRVFPDVVYAKARPGEEDNKLLGEGESVAEGARFTARVTFENLGLAELGGVLCALEPGLLLHDLGDGGGDPTGEPARYGWAVGGGRPLGFGAVTAEVTLAALDDAASRYLGAQTPTPDVAEAVRAFRASVPRATKGAKGEGLRDVWKRQLTKVLRLDWAPPDRVWYPPADEIAAMDRPLDPMALKASFAFWKESAGQWMKNGGTAYRQLPSAAAPDPSMKVVPDKGGFSGRGGGTGRRAGPRGSR